LRIDGQLVAANRLFWPQYLAPGSHVFEAKKPGFGSAMETRTLAVGNAVVALKLKAGVDEGAAPGAGTKDEPKRMPTRVKVAWIAGGVLGGIAIGTWMGAGGTYFSMEDAVDGNGCGNGCREQYDSRKTLLTGLSTTAVISGALGLGALGYAIYGTLTNRQGQVGVRLLPTTNGAVLVGTF